MAGKLTRFVEQTFGVTAALAIALIVIAALIGPPVVVALIVLAFLGC